jgi:hypothetical protein
MTDIDTCPLCGADDFQDWPHHAAEDCDGLDYSQMSGREA